MKRGFIAMVAGLLIAGCGGDDDEVAPAACLDGQDAYLTALEGAPQDVQLEGSASISDCIVENQDGGELAQIGEGMVGAATELNRLARRDPAGADTVRLGYLVGAVQEAASTTGGIHEDLVIRLDAAARFSGGEQALPASFERAFGTGYAAGQASG